MISKTYYEILGVSPDATTAKIKSAARRLLGVVHEDLHQDEDEVCRRYFHQRTIEIIEARDVLKDPEQRANYNALLKIRSSSSPSTAPQKPAFTPAPPSTPRQSMRNDKTKTLRAEIDALRKLQSWRCLWLLVFPIGWPGVLSISFIKIHGAVPHAMLYVAVPSLVIGLAVLVPLLFRQLNRYDRLIRLEARLIAFTGP